MSSDAGSWRAYRCVPESIFAFTLRAFPSKYSDQNGHFFVLFFYTGHRCGPAPSSHVFPPHPYRCRYEASRRKRGRHTNGRGTSMSAECGTRMFLSSRGYVLLFCPGACHSIALEDPNLSPLYGTLASAVRVSSLVPCLSPGPGVVLVCVVLVAVG